MSQIPNTLIIGKVLQELESCLSTNLYAKQLLAKSKPLEGTAISTDNQTAGRGQYGNNWQSEAGKNIAFSVILYPKIPVSEQFYISKITSLACVKALKSISNLDFEIKWPNDIYYKNQKLGGILIENQIAGNNISNSVVGIGINLNQETFDNLPHASSLFLLVRYLLSRKKCLEILIQHLDAEYLRLKQGNYAKIDAEYHQLLKAYQTEFTFKEDGEIKIGVVQEVNKAGQLVVAVKGEMKAYNFKEIEWVF